MYRITIDGADEMHETRDPARHDGYATDDDPAVSITAPWDASPTCPSCGADVWEEINGWDGHEDGCELEGEDLTPRLGPVFGLFNWIGARVDGENDAVHLDVSIGDPRGALRMSVRRLPDGRKILHVPSAGESFAHVPLTPSHPGTYEIREPRPADPVAVVLTADEARGILEDLERSHRGPGRAMRGAEKIRAALADRERAP